MERNSGEEFHLYTIRRDLDTLSSDAKGVPWVRTEEALHLTPIQISCYFGASFGRCFLCKHNDVHRQ